MSVLDEIGIGVGLLLFRLQLSSATVRLLPCSTGEQLFINEQKYVLV